MEGQRNRGKSSSITMLHGDQNQILQDIGPYQKFTISCHNPPAFYCGLKLHNLGLCLVHRDYHTQKGWWEASLEAHLIHVLLCHDTSLSTMPFTHRDHFQVHAFALPFPLPCGILGPFWPGPCQLPQNHILPFQVPALFFYASRTLTSHHSGTVSLSTRYLASLTLRH